MRERPPADPSMLNKPRHPRRRRLGRLRSFGSGRLAGLVAALVALAGGGRRAHANGAFPDSQSIMTPEAAPNEILLATNFGIVSTVDGGHTWLWTCEQAENSFATLYQLGPGLRLYALSSVGLAFSDNRSCGWTVAGGLAGPKVFDYFPDPTKASRVLALTTEVTDAAVTYQVIESSDGGATFNTVRYTAPAGTNLTGVETARAAPMTVYLSMTTGSSFAPELARSTDGGGTWRLYPLATSLATGTNSIRIIAVDPDDPNKVYLRVSSKAGDAVAVSKFDAAGDASTATGITLTPGGVLTAFVRLPNGHIVVKGVVGVDRVAYRSTDGAASFQQLPMPPDIRALSARGSTLYAVANNVPPPDGDGYAIGTSTDEGMTWTPLMTYDQIAAIDPCAKQLCQDDCLMRADIGQWSPDFCAATAPGSDGGAAGSGGAAGGTGGGAAGTTGTGGTGGAAGGGGTTTSSPGGCHCAVGGRSGDGAGGISGLWLALALAARRRPSRPSPRP